MSAMLLAFRTAAQGARLGSLLRCLQQRRHWRSSPQHFLLRLDPTDTSCRERRRHTCRGRKRNRSQRKTNSLCPGRISKPRFLNLDRKKMGRCAVERPSATRARSDKRPGGDRNRRGCASARWRTVRHSSCRIPRSLAGSRREKLSLAARRLCLEAIQEAERVTRRHLSPVWVLDRVRISTFRGTRLESQAQDDPSLAELPGKLCIRTNRWRAGSKSLRVVAEKVREALARNARIALRSLACAESAPRHEPAQERASPEEDRGER